MRLSYPSLPPGAIAALTALVMLGALAGCGPAGVDDTPARPAPPDSKPSITGSITTLDVSGAGGVMLVESDAPSTGQYDAASVRVDDGTVLLRERDDGAYAEITFDELSPGLTVDVWFTGPVAESYPVQATAGTVVLRR